MTSMPWFPFYVDDFMASPKVARMSLEEVGVYVMLLCQQHQEGAVEWPCERIANALRGHERSIEYVLSECFRETPEGWKNPRLERIHNEQKAKSEKASKAAKARWDNASDADASANAKRTQSERNANQNQNQKELRTSDGTYTKAFQELWDVCKRGSRKKAFEQYHRARVGKEIEHDVLLSKWKEHVEAARSTEFVAHLFRWLRDERWEEELPSTNGKGADSDEIDVDTERERHEKLLADNAARRTA